MEGGGAEESETESRARERERKKERKGGRRSVEAAETNPRSVSQVTGQAHTALKHRQHGTGQMDVSVYYSWFCQP